MAPAGEGRKEGESGRVGEWENGSVDISDAI
jgi:hypothetical protein